MSRAFVKEDADADPVMVPSRAPLPEGVPNLVTPEGLGALERERDSLEGEVERLRAADDTRAVAAATGRLEELRARLLSAQVMDPPARDGDEVVFGSRVELRRSDGRPVRLRIVGVDEADPSVGNVALTAPLADAALGKRVGDSFVARIGGDQVRFEVVSVET